MLYGNLAVISIVTGQGESAEDKAKSGCTSQTPRFRYLGNIGTALIAG
jgi:hypothetical protein